MAWSIVIHEDKEFALVELRGEVHGHDVVEAARQLQEEERWSRDFSVIWDGRGITSLILEPDDLAEMVDAKAEVSRGMEITVAVRELDQEMAKVCALLLRVRGREAKVVHTLEKALRLLETAHSPRT